jgi:hypothetical protein
VTGPAALVESTVPTESQNYGDLSRRKIVKRAMCSDVHLDYSDHDARLAKPINERQASSASRERVDEILPDIPSDA